MSYKGNDIEDKSEAAPVPRSIPALRSLMGEVRQAMVSRRLQSLPGLIEELQSSRRKLQSEMYEAARVGSPSSVIEAYSGISNEALALYGEAQSMASPGLGTVRS